jgi:hypothetical protein
MKIQTRSPTFFALLFLLSGCVTVDAVPVGVPPPASDHTVVAYSGRVEGRALVQGLKGSTGIVYNPALHGGLSILLAETFLKTGSTPTHYLYAVRVQGQEDRLIEIKFPGDIAVGECVDVVAGPTSAGAAFFFLGEASLRKSLVCK